jgi:hypothetical protein
MKPNCQPHRSRTVGCKVTDEEYAQLAGHVEGMGTTLGEWSRGVLLEHVQGRPPSTAERAVLSEVLALRTIVLNCHYALATGERITDEEMRGLIQRADAGKAEEALKRLTDVGKAGGAR